MNSFDRAVDAQQANLLAWARVLWSAMTKAPPERLQIIERARLLPSSFPGINLLISPSNTWTPIGAWWQASHQVGTTPALRCKESLHCLLGSSLDVADVETDLPDADEAPWAVLVDGDDGHLALTAPLNALDHLLAPEPQSGVLWIPTTLTDPIQQSMITRVVPPTAAVFAGRLGIWAGQFTPDDAGGTFLPVHRVNDAPEHRLQFAAALGEADGNPARRCELSSNGISEGFSAAWPATWMKSDVGVWAIRVDPGPR